MPFLKRLVPSRKSTYLLDVRQQFDFVTVSTFFSSLLSGKGIGIVMFSALTVIRSELILL
jgi:hypothetical protein